MNFRAQAILCAARPQGETAITAHMLTARQGLIAAYVAGGRGRQLRPVVIPGNLIDLELRGQAENRLPFARLELVESRGPWLNEPLPASAIGWSCALTAAVLPERHAYPAIYSALGALLTAICHAPSARGWTAGLVSYEALLLRELGYGGNAPPAAADWAAVLAAFDQMGALLQRYLLADRRADVMAARDRLRATLARI